MSIFLFFCLLKIERTLESMFLLQENILGGFGILIKCDTQTNCTLILLLMFV